VDRQYNADGFREALMDNKTGLCIPGQKSSEKFGDYGKRRHRMCNRIETLFGLLMN
jgi:hypothetical protein